MYTFMAGLAILILIMVLIPVTGIAISDHKASKETIQKWANFYSVGITVGMMYTAIGAVIVLFSAILSMFA